MVSKRLVNLCRPRIETLSVGLAAVLLSLSTIGSSCVNENAHVSVNLSPIVGRYKLGTNPTFFGTITVKLDSIVARDYKNKIRQGRIYDLKVRVEGEYGGEVAGIAAVQAGNGDPKQILRFPRTGSVNWSVYRQPQSLLGNSIYLLPQPEGINELLSALLAKPLPDITFSVVGTLSIAPVPDNLYVVVEVYLQADAEIN